MTGNADIRVRGVTLQDSPAICAVHRGSDGPWADPTECAIHVNHRLLRPFHCHVAERRGQIVGHAEWIIGKEPDLPGPFLYLGMLQVRQDCQGQGVGRALIEYGARLAIQKGCDRVRTVPEEGVEGFYARCGFKTAGEAMSYRLRVQDCAAPQGWKKGRSVPEGVPGKLLMRFGWVQACATHMWEISNRPARVAGDTFVHSCLMRDDGYAFVQLRFRDPSEALALAWSGPDVSLEALLSAAYHLGAAHLISALLLARHPKEIGGLPGDAESRGGILILERMLSR